MIKNYVIIIIIIVIIVQYQKYKRFIMGNIITRAINFSHNIPVTLYTLET
jgi:hypothetical protein